MSPKVCPSFLSKIKLKSKGVLTLQLHWQLSKFISTLQLQPKLVNCCESFQFQRKFPISEETFQLHSAFSNLKGNFPTSDYSTSRSFQLPLDCYNTDPSLKLIAQNCNKFWTKTWKFSWIFEKSSRQKCFKRTNLKIHFHLRLSDRNF